MRGRTAACTPYVSMNTYKFTIYINTYYMLMRSARVIYIYIYIYITCYNIYIYIERERYDISIYYR